MFMYKASFVQVAFYKAKLDFKLHNFSILKNIA